MGAELDRTFGGPLDGIELAGGFGVMERLEAVW
jgi:hypothetical protein